MRQFACTVRVYVWYNYVTPWPRKFCVHTLLYVASVNWLEIRCCDDKGRLTYCRALNYTCQLKTSTSSEMLPSKLEVCMTAEEIIDHASATAGRANFSMTEAWWTVSNALLQSLTQTHRQTAVQIMW